MLSGTTSKAAMKRMHRTHTCRRSVHFRLLRRETVGLMIGANQNTCTVVLCVFFCLCAHDSDTTLVATSGETRFTAHQYSVGEEICWSAVPVSEKHKSPHTNVQWIVVSEPKRSKHDTCICMCTHLGKGSCHERILAEIIVVGLDLKDDKAIRNHKLTQDVLRTKLSRSDC